MQIQSARSHGVPRSPLDGPTATYGSTPITHYFAPMDALTILTDTDDGLAGCSNAETAVAQATTTTGRRVDQPTVKQ